MMVVAERWLSVERAEWRSEGGAEGAEQAGHVRPLLLERVGWAA